MLSAMQHSRWPAACAAAEEGTTWREAAVVDDRCVITMRPQHLKDTPAGMHSAGALCNIEQRHDSSSALHVTCTTHSDSCAEASIPAWCNNCWSLQESHQRQEHRPASAFCASKHQLLAQDHLGTASINYATNPGSPSYSPSACCLASLLTGTDLQGSNLLIALIAINGDHQPPGTCRQLQPLRRMPCSHSVSQRQKRHSMRQRAVLELASRSHDMHPHILHQEVCWHQPSGKYARRYSPQMHHWSLTVNGRDIYRTGKGFITLPARCGLGLGPGGASHHTP